MGDGEHKLSAATQAFQEGIQSGFSDINVSVVPRVVTKDRFVVIATGTVDTPIL